MTEQHSETQMARRQLRSSYITTTISIALLLFLIGIIGLILLNAQRLSNHVKENLGFTVLIRDNVRDAEVKKLEKQLAASNYVKSATYISKEQAAEMMQKELGEDFVEFLGYNPLLASIDVRLYAEYTTPESIAKIEKELLSTPEVKDIHYQKDLLYVINKNVRRISLILGIFSALMLFIAMALINNTIRLSIYSKRFIIRTMQLVGATSGHIRKPFLTKSIFYGFIGSLIAILLLSALIYFSSKELKGFIGFEVIDLIGLLFLIVIGLGIFISWISTFFAVSKFLFIKTDKLY
ncbi:cell division transport system permease protein [Breznakibacter xylanolyticus]|uniref:Cell division protein FtsX n=1 Tax=Breznakibacter xylanolyticus TaxID=990 RepID=A0A2W7QCE0_9BACT|nr:permease-like cell division protein FtsX [Breznakibacter xylanolyticus]PZX19469.1 cell division transport system permease protein [Breznakibacter xylanolyticus]